MGMRFTFTHAGGTRLPCRAPCIIIVCPQRPREAPVLAAVEVRQRPANPALRNHRHDVTMGFDKTWGQDVLYPQGGLHVASAAANLLKQPPGLQRFLARLLKKPSTLHRDRSGNSKRSSI